MIFAVSASTVLTINLNDYEILLCPTMSKALPENNKTFDDVLARTGMFMTSSCILGSVQVEKK